jgi:asparagine synthase (glutamine-hydrolysing)
VTVSLSGDGGDELFAGYNRYTWGTKLARAIRSVPRPLRAVGASVARGVPVGAWDRLTGGLPQRWRLPQSGDKIHKLADIVDAPSRENAYLRLTSLWQHPANVVRGSREPETMLADPSCWPCAHNFLESMMLLDAQTYLPGDILTKVDRASMAVGLEARVPLLDHRVVEFAWRLPLNLKLQSRSGKWLLRRVLGRYVPTTLIDRPKMGFGVPIDSWLRGDLRDWAESLLDETRLRQEGYFDPKPVRAIWNEHQNGRRNWQHRIWAVLMFQSWLSEWGHAR